METTQVYETVKPDQLIGRVYQLMRGGYRLAQISATKKETFDLIYSFDKDYGLVNLRVEVGEHEEIESISGLYEYAYLYENELKDLFGVNILHMNIDFKGHLYKTSIKTPFNRRD